MEFNWKLNHEFIAIEYKSYLELLRKITMFVYVRILLIDEIPVICQYSGVDFQLDIQGRIVDKT